MFNILIVDDDFRDRSGICNVIKRKKWPLKTFTADCGTEAEKILTSQKIDIMITDIKIPDMLGTDLAEKAKKMQPNLKIILVSAYKDFHYAKAAIKFGAINYLLKPYLLDELISSIDNVVELCLKENADNLPQPNISYPVTVNDDTLLRFLAGTSDIPEEQINSLITPSGLRIIILKILKNEDTLDNSNISAEIKKTFDKQIKIVNMPKKQYIILDKIPEANIKPYLENAVNLFRNKYKTEVCIIYSPIITSTEEIVKEYQSIQQTSEYFFFANKSMIISSDDEFFNKKGDSSLSTDFLLEKIDLFINMGNFDDFLITLTQLFTHLRQSSHCSPLYVKCISANIINKLLKNRSGIRNLEQEKIEKLFATNSIDEILPVFESIVEIISTEKQDNSSHRLISKTLSIIEAEYMNNISLEYVSERIFISSSYLSHLFKKETGQNFIEYLRDFRLKKSCELLKNTNLRITEICKKIGYDSASYFNTIFRQVYGITPAQYREKGIQNVDKESSSPTN